MQASCDKQPFSSNPSLQSHTDDEKEDNELQASRSTKSIGSQIYERQRQRVENSLASNSANGPRPFSTLQRNPSRSSATSNDRPKVNEIESLREEDESSITRAQSLRNLTQKFEKMQAKTAVETQQQQNGVRPVAKRFSMLEPVSMSNGGTVESHRGVMDITPSKESLVELHRKLEGMMFPSSKLIVDVFRLHKRAEKYAHPTDSSEQRGAQYPSNSTS